MSFASANILMPWQETAVNVAVTPQALLATLFYTFSHMVVKEN